MSRFDMSDFEWKLISPLLPNKSRGVARVDDRRVLNGIFTGFAWVVHGEIYLNDTDPIPLFTIDLIAGRKLEFGIN